MANTNGFEGVPWMTGGGARHSADVGRVLAYAATSGGDGIVKPGDLKVVPTAGSPNLQVHMGTGAVAIRNRSAAAVNGSQTYVGRAVSTSDLDVASTGGSARSDLVVVRVKDPQFSPWQPYGAGTPERANGPYIFPEIIPGVPSNTVRAEQLGLSHSMYAVARIDVPANTSTVTAAYIKDLRDLVLPREHAEVYMGAATGIRTIPAVNASYQRWVGALEPQVEIPTWATRCMIVSTFSSVVVDGLALPNALIRTQLGSLVGSSAVIDFDNRGLTSPTGETFVLATGGDCTSMAGTTQQLQTWVQTIRIGMSLRSNTQMTHTVHFYESRI